MGEVISLEQAARERGQRVGQVVRSIVFRVGEGDFVMVLAAGPAHISWKGMRQHLGQSRMTMATPEEVLGATSYPIGAVSPFGLPRLLRILIDQSVLKEDVVSLGCGVRNMAVLLSTVDLRRALPHAELLDILQSS